MRSLYKLKKEITIIIVAHRLNTIKICDQIFHLEKGEIKNKGSFEELKKKDKFFQTIEDKSN
jgi:ATP-binding cassette subfamily B protein